MDDCATPPPAGAGTSPEARGPRDRGRVLVFDASSPRRVPATAGRTFDSPPAVREERPRRRCDRRTRSPSCSATASARSCRGPSIPWPRPCRSSCEFEPVDFSLENRRAAEEPAIYDEAVASIEANGVALKYPTITAEESPNQILRRRLDLSVIHRPVDDDPRRADELPTRAGPGHRPDRHRRHLRRSRPDDRRRRRGQPADRRASGRSQEAARYAFNLARKTGKRVTSTLEVHDPEGHRRPVRGGRRRGRRPVPGGAAQRRAVRRPARQDHHGAGAVPGRAGAQRVRRLPLRHGLRPGRVAGHRRQRQPGLRRLRRGPRGDCSTPRTAPPPTSPARTWPTRRRSSWPWSLLLYQIGEISVAQAVKDATLDLLRQGTRTGDLGGQESTDSFTAAVAEEVRKQLASGG